MPQRPQPSAFWPTLAVVMTIVAVAAVGYSIRCHRQGAEPTGPVIVEPLEDRRVLRPASFDELPGWKEDALAEALPALRRSCEVFAARDPASAVGPEGIAGAAADWAAICDALLAATGDDDLRATIERLLEPFQVLNNEEVTGLFTGYYEPSLSGSRSRSEDYTVPLYRKPPDLLKIDLEPFHERFAGRSISGRVGDGTFQPYYDRGEISQGALARRDLELVWVDDPIDAFFLHIQGSGRVALPDGGEMRVGYEGQNGRPYFAIGRELVERGALTLEEVSLQSIRAWLEEHPEEAGEVMATNPSFVFFRELEGEGPVGTLGVALTPGRSLAIDRSMLPLGIPVWLDAMAPAGDGGADRPVRRLMVAQDTGGAIKGPVRGDVFWGHGEIAEHVAGHMKHEGRLWLLLPRGVDEGPASP